MRRTIGDKAVSEQRLEEVLSGMVAATAVPGAAYDWQQDDSGDGGYRVKFAERPGDQVLARISAAILRVSRGALPFRHQALNRGCSAKRL